MLPIPDLSQLDPDEQIRRNLIARPNLSPGLNLPGIGPSAPPASPSSLTGGVHPAHTGPIETSGLGKLGAMPDPPMEQPQVPSMSPAQSKLNFLRSSPAGVDQLHPKSVIGKVGKVGLQGLDMIGSIAAPGMM